MFYYIMLIHEYGMGKHTLPILGMLEAKSNYQLRKVQYYFRDRFKMEDSKWSPVRKV